MGEVLLRAHFGAVFPGRGAEAFAAWWQHAEAHGLCYSLECVVPRILGDHGATPTAAYMVLTIISHVSGGGTFLSPAQLLAPPPRGAFRSTRLPLCLGRTLRLRKTRYTPQGGP